MILQWASSGNDTCTLVPQIQTDKALFLFCVRVHGTAALSASLAGGHSMQQLTVNTRAGGY